MKLQHRTVDQAAAAGQQADEAYGRAIPVLGCKSTEHVSQTALYQGTTSVVPQAAEKSYFLAAAGLRVAKRSARKNVFLSLQTCSLGLKTRGGYLSLQLLLLIATILLPAAAQAQQLMPGRIPKVTSTFPQFRIADSLISEDGGGIHIGAMSIAPSGWITLCCGQNFGDGAWSLSGNSGTGCTTSPCSSFLGTNDNTSLEIRVNGQRAYRIEPATDPVMGFSPNVIAGHSGNVVAGSGVAGATIGGGGSGLTRNGDSSYFVNRVTASFGTVGGGLSNTASGNGSTVAGGQQNHADGGYSFVGGGFDNVSAGLDSSLAGGVHNTAGGNYSTLAGGMVNNAAGWGSTVAGGGGNVAIADFATVGGGFLNTASGRASFAAGQHANTNNHSGVFVWGDNSTLSTQAEVKATADNQFVARASGGVIFYTSSDLTAGASLSPGSGSWSSLSDRNVKANFAAVDRRQLLTRVLALPISTWNYKTQAESIRHIGPMAQDFYAAFHIGEDDKHITTIDEGGVALAAIQGLYEIMKEKDEQIAVLQQQIEAMRSDLKALARATVTETSK